MNKLSNEQENIIEMAKEVKGEQRQFTKFIQEEIIDKGYQDYLSDEKFVIEMEKANKKFKASIEFLKKSEKDRLREYFVDDNNNLIISKKELDSIPEDRFKRYELAKRKENEGNFDMAKRLYKSIKDLGEDSVAKFMSNLKKSKQKGAKGFEEMKDEEIRISTYYKSKFSYYICKVKNKEKLTKEEKEEINEMLKEDRKKIKDLLMGGADIEFIMSILGEEINIETLEREILPNIREDTEEQGGTNGETTGGKPKANYSAEELLDLFKNIGEIKKVTLGKDGLDGFVLFTYENITIAEKFFKRDNFGDMVEDRASTYLVHKRAKLDLEKATKGELVESKNAVRHKKRGEKLLDCSYHSIHYKDNLRKKYRAMDRIKFDKETGEIIVEERKIIKSKDQEENGHKGQKQEVKKTDKGNDGKEIAVDEVAEEQAAEEIVADEVVEEQAAEEIVADEVVEEQAVEEIVADEVAGEQAVEEIDAYKTTEGQDVEEVAADKAAEESNVEDRKNHEKEMLNEIEKVDKQNEELHKEKEELRNRMKEYFDIIEMVKEERAENVKKSLDKNVKEILETAKKILLESQQELQKALKGLRDIDNAIKKNKEIREKLVASYVAKQDQELDKVISASMDYLNSDEIGE